MAPEYRHTQTGHLIRAAIASGVVLALVATALARWHPIGFGVAAILAVTGALFGSLTVAVGSGELRIRFGPGPLGWRWPLDQITGAQAVRNAWWYGWGIRLIPSGWLYNVSGLDAVEVTLRSGRRVRIGTDEPERLVAAIQQHGAGLRS